MMIGEDEVKDKEIDVFLEALKHRFGYDFTEYARNSLTRRVHDLQVAVDAETVSDLIKYVFHQQDFLPLILDHLSVQFSEIFRDPHFYIALRKEVVPILKTYPQINIWVAGCGNGEEAYSLAILLKEEGLLDRANIYATDISMTALDRAKEGIYPNDDLTIYEDNYLMAGGYTALENYYVNKYEFLAIDPSLKDHIFFLEHNLTADGVFCEMHLIICRNVLIYFNRNLQNKCLELFQTSLIREGFLGLGEKENVDLSSYKETYSRLTTETPLFRKKAV